MGITGLQAFLRLIRRLTPDDGLPLLAFSPKPEGFAGSFLNQFCPGFSLEEDGIDKDLFDIL
jgi:hypothetical protein